MAYNPKLVKLIVNGRFITGLGSGDFFSYTEPDKYTDYAGADGEVEYSERATNHCDVSVTLKNTSPSNQYLESLYGSKEEIDMTKKDGNPGSMNFSGTDGVIVKRADDTRGPEIGERTWDFKFPQHSVR